MPRRSYGVRRRKNVANGNSRLAPKRRKKWRTYKPGTALRQMLCRFFDHSPLHRAEMRKLARKAAKRRVKRDLLRARGEV